MLINIEIKKKLIYIEYKGIKFALILHNLMGDNTICA